MAFRCCRDSVAMWLRVHDAPSEGQEVFCRWGNMCEDGYARFENGQWAFHTPKDDRATHQGRKAIDRLSQVSHDSIAHWPIGYGKDHGCHDGIWTPTTRR